MEFHLHINMQGAAMKTRDDLATVMEAVAAQLHQGRSDVTVMDVNGNTVGSFSWDGDMAEFELIEQAANLSPEGDVDDVEAALEIIWGNGGQDDDAGEVDGPFGQDFRVGRWTLHTNSDGVKTVTDHGTEDAAEEHMDALHEREAEIGEDE